VVCYLTLGGLIYLTLLQALENQAKGNKRLARRLEIYLTTRVARRDSILGVIGHQGARRQARLDAIGICGRLSETSLKRLGRQCKRSGDREHRPKSTRNACNAQPARGIVARAPARPTIGRVLPVCTFWAILTRVEAEYLMGRCSMRFNQAIPERQYPDGQTVGKSLRLCRS
jgi:hypothetical protein